MDAWVAEVCELFVNCDQKALSQRVFLAEYNPSNPVPSHFTQVVWKGTSQVGCAVSTCSGIFDAKFGVCSTMPSPSRIN